MPVESENRTLPEEIVPACPKCGQYCRKLNPSRSFNEDLYNCPECGLNFEATIQILWGEK